MKKRIGAEGFRTIEAWLRHEALKIRASQPLAAAGLIQAAGIDGTDLPAWSSRDPQDTSRGLGDPDARVGRGKKGFLLGYLSLFLVDIEGFPLGHIESPLNVNEKQLMEPLLDRVLGESLEEALHRLYRRIDVPPMDRPPPGMAGGLVEEARAEMLRLAGRSYESAEVRRFAGKVLNGVDHWFTFLTVPGVEATNNMAERALREHVVQRKIMGCFRNGKGTRIYETVMTLLATWKQQGRDLSQTLGEALTQEWTRS